ncbi:hypothetical protein VN97_g8625 [Penicillium thymicola]|uniref:Uncharacterized protein n=1 Tax=Penicillium thymicola TaxID=293382 RepID=A0AAI9TD51_PENTH|nr:hypothetical protein VN97_g8625 [Penicillium thymicola]
MKVAVNIAAANAMKPYAPADFLVNSPLAAPVWFTDPLTAVGVSPNPSGRPWCRPLNSPQMGPSPRPQPINGRLSKPIKSPFLYINTVLVRIK